MFLNVLNLGSSHHYIIILKKSENSGNNAELLFNIHDFTNTFIMLSFLLTVRQICYCRSEDSCREYEEARRALSRATLPCPALPSPDVGPAQSVPSTGSPVRQVKKC